MRVFLIGYPGEMGGANTEAWHTIVLWKTLGIDVHLIPTWRADAYWKHRLDELGCVTHNIEPDQLETVALLAGCPAVGFCNHHFTTVAHRLRAMGCPLVWVNCMTFLFDHEKDCFSTAGLPDAFVYQSHFQRLELETQLQHQFSYDPACGHVIRGAFDCKDWPFDPRPHGANEAFTIGRLARPDLDKWSSNTWPIYSSIQYANKRALMLGVNEDTLLKLGTPPPWADCLKPMAIPVRKYYAMLHCLLPINGGARENWPRVGLEAMATGVPIVAQNAWGWREMIIHGETGFLGNCDEELAHYSAMLAYDENLRMRIVRAAHEKLVSEFANPILLANAWLKLFKGL